jgi:predicted DCC family thiol-disulfide oxidoreductase YuxK
VQRLPYAYRADPAVPHFADDRPIIIFDGHCVLCSAFAQFVVKHDRDARFRLMAAQSDLGRALYRHFGLDPVNYDTYVLLLNGEAYFRSDASIRILQGLGGAWRILAKSARFIPAPLRDSFYNVIARNRLRWFGTRAQCYLPSPSQADRFLS